MTSIQVRKWTVSGQDRFVSLIRDRPDDLLDQLDDLSVDSTATEMIPHENAPVTIHLTPMKRRLELAKHLDSLFGPGQPLASLAGDVRLWNWLSAAWMRTLVASSGKDIKSALGKQDERWVLTSNTLRYHRHLVSSPYFAYDSNREDPRKAMCLLATDILAPGEVVERIAGKRSLSTGSVCHLATLLYFDGSTGTLRSGHTSKPGNPKMFSYFFSQIDLNVDYVGVDVDSLLKLLPKNFERWVKLAVTDRASEIASGLS